MAPSLVPFALSQLGSADGVRGLFSVVRENLKMLFEGRLPPKEEEWIVLTSVPSSKQSATDESISEWTLLGDEKIGAHRVVALAHDLKARCAVTCNHERTDGEHAGEEGVAALASDLQEQCAMMSYEQSLHSQAVSSTSCVRAASSRPIK